MVSEPRVDPFFTFVPASGSVDSTVPAFSASVRWLVEPDEPGRRGWRVVVAVAARRPTTSGMVKFVVFPPR